jgi:hypothetical protein
MAKLKVFRTAIGFHDAYVAAPSRKAALKAWGTTKDLFSRGGAEIVTDSKLTKVPLASPGEVFKLSRGSAAEQLAALPNDASTKARRAKPPSMSKLKTSTKPRPDRRQVEEAQAALDDAVARHLHEAEDLDAQIDRLNKQRRALDAAHDKEITGLEKTRSTAEARYRRAMEKWRDGRPRLPDASRLRAR